MIIPIRYPPLANQNDFNLLWLKNSLNYLKCTYLVSPISNCPHFIRILLEIHVISKDFSGPQLPNLLAIIQIQDSIELQNSMIITIRYPLANQNDFNLLWLKKVTKLLKMHIFSFPNK